LRFVLVILLLLPAIAAGSVSLHAVCEADGSVAITITAENDAMPPDWLGLVVTRTRIGVCDVSENLTEAPLDLPAPGDELIHRVDSSVPLPGVNYRFETRAVDANGRLYDLPGAVYDHAALGLAPSFIGRVVYEADDAYRLEGCTADCWPTCNDISASQLGVSDFQMLMWATKSTTIAIYAAPAGPLASNDCFEYVTAVKIAPPCFITPNESASWSSLKSSYR